MPRAPGTMPVPPLGGSPSPGRSFFHSFFPSLSAAFREAKRRRLSARARIERFRAETPTRLDSPRVALFTREHSILLSFRQLRSSSSSASPIGPAPACSFTSFLGGALVAATFPPLGHTDAYALARDIITISVDTHRRFIPREFIPTLAT